ncbi:MAG: hypothetical protein WCL14_13720 [Bacteroidota bacterium]
MKKLTALSNAWFLMILIVIGSGFTAKGQSYNNWNCPDAKKLFPLINIKLWANTPAVYGRLPTYQESQNGTSLMYFGNHGMTDARPYDMTLPRLASFHNQYTKTIDTVVVIQVVKTAHDTIAGFRYLTGGNGTHDFRGFHFFSDEEVKETVGY